MQWELQANAVLNTEEKSQCPLDFTSLDKGVSYFWMLDISTNKIYPSIPFCSLDKEEKHVTESWEWVKVYIWARKAHGMALLANDAVGPTGRVACGSWCSWLWCGLHHAESYISMSQASGCSLPVSSCSGGGCWKPWAVPTRTCHHTGTDVPVGSLHYSGTAFVFPFSSFANKKNPKSWNLMWRV